MKKRSPNKDCKSTVGNGSKTPGGGITRAAEILARELESRIALKLRQACVNGSVLACLFWRNGDRVQLWFKAHDFPVADYDSCIDILDEKLREDRKRVLAANELTRKPRPKPKKKPKS